MPNAGIVREFRFRHDDGSESGATWVAAVNTAATLSISGDTLFRIRQVIDTLTGISNEQIGLKVSHNGGASATVGPSSVYVQGGVSANVTDGGNTTEQLPRVSGDSYQIKPGVINNTNAYNDTSHLISLFSNGNETELEWTLKLILADLTSGDTLDFTVFGQSGTASFNQYSSNVRLTVNLSTTYSQSMNASATLTPGFIKRVGKIASASASLNAILINQAGKTLSAALAFAAAFLKTIGKPVAKSVTATPSALKGVGKPVLATSTLSPSISKGVGKPLAASASLAASLLTPAVKVLSASVSLTGSLIRSVGKLLLRGVFANTSTLVKSISRKISVSVALTPTFDPIQAVSQVLTASVSLTATFTHGLFVELAATVGLTIRFIKEVSKLFIVPVQALHFFTRRTAKIVRAAITLAPTLLASHPYHQILSASVSLGASLTKQIQGTLKASVILMSRISRGIGRILAAVVVLTGTLTPTKTRIVQLALTIGLTPTLIKRISKPFTVFVSVLASFRKTWAKLLIAIVTLTPTLQSVKAFILTASVSLHALIYKDIGKPLRASVVTLLASLPRSIGKVLTVPVTLSARIFKRITYPVSAGVNLIPTLLRRATLTRILTTSVTLTAQLYKGVGRTLNASVVALRATLTRQVGKGLRIAVSLIPTLTKTLPRILNAVVNISAEAIRFGTGYAQLLITSVTLSPTLRKTIGKLLLSCVSMLLRFVPVAIKGVKRKPFMKTKAIGHGDSIEGEQAGSDVETISKEDNRDTDSGVG